MVKDESIVVSVRIPSKLLAKIDRIAEADRNRPRSSMILILIEDGIAVREANREGKSKVRGA
jgi:metal-responsive CopG/Arc/MetJ family transcriptional regulator